MITEVMKVECPYCMERIRIIKVSRTAADCMAGEQILTIYEPYAGTAAEPRRS